MRIINVNLDALSTQNLDIGYVGESHHVEVNIHCASFFKAYPNATAAMVAEPPEGDLYPVNLTRDNSTLVWTINDSDLVNPGSGKFQITFTQGNEIIKTAFGSYSVSASMVANGEAPEPIEDWMQEAQQVLNDLESFDDISASATTLPAGSSATAQITEVEGHKNISIGIPKGDTGAGITPDISIGTVETLQPNESAYVELDESSTPEEPVLNFGIPQGETGTIADAYATTIPMSSSDSTKISAAIGAKLDANQGSGNAGKFMKVGNDGSVTPEEVDVDISGKADKVSSATSGNLAGLDANGNLTDSGSKASDFLTEHQDISGKADKAATVLTSSLSCGRKTNTFAAAKSCAFGVEVTASNTASFAIGERTNATGGCSFASGGWSTASANYAFATGSHTTASGANSMTAGYYTTAQRKSQFVFGEFNIADTVGSTSTRGNYIEIVGNGSMTFSKNARALDWYGNERIAGDLYIHCAADSSGGQQVIATAFNGATASTAGSLGLVPAPSAGANLKFLRGDGTWQNASGGGHIMPSSAISIPEYGSPVTYNMTGITANHQLIRWNFSASAENSPPVDLEWTTGAGTFTITNAGGTTSETIQPVFAEVTGVTATLNE